MRISEEKKELLKEYFINEKDIIAVYVFGSHGTDLETPLSDIDFAILFADSHEADLKREMEIMARLTLILKEEEIDLVNLNQAPICLQHEIIKTGDLIYEEDEAKIADFVRYVLTFYYDEKIRAEKYYSVYEKALKEEYVNERGNTE